VAARVVDNVLGLIGSTPLVRLSGREKAGGARIYAKFEPANPGGSVKDRIALAMLDDAEARGLLKEGSGVVIEPTSGNTGIGLAMVCAVKRWRCVLVAPEGLPPRRLAVLKAYGAELRQTPFELGMKGAVDEAMRLASENPGWFSPMQFSSRANVAIHKKTTAREIFKALKGAVDVFVAGVGTGGTLSGVGEYLRKKRPSVRIVAVEPARSPVLSGGAPGAHAIQGIGAGFVPAIFDPGSVDEIISVEDEDALQSARDLARQDGLLVGISAGANVWAAAKLAAGLGKNKNVVTVLCDRGEPYLDPEGMLQ
jgi:cysteine synthase A